MRLVLWQSFLQNTVTKSTVRNNENDMWFNYRTKDSHEPFFMNQKHTAQPVCWVLVHFNESKMYTTSSVAWFLTILVLIMVWLHDDELKNGKFSLTFNKFWLETIPLSILVHMDPAKMTKKNAVLCMPGSIWQCDFVKKHHASALISTDWTCNIRAHDDAQFFTADKGIIFKNLHFEFYFQKFAFSGLQMPLLGTWAVKTHKNISVFSWKTVLCNAPSVNQTHTS